MPKARILFLYPNSFVGPVMTVFSQIVRHLDGSRFAPYVAVNADAMGTLPIGQHEATIRQLAFGHSLAGGSLRDRASSAGKLLLSMASLFRWLRKERMSLVQCSATPYAGTLAVVLSLATGVPVVAHVHELVGRYAGGRRHTPMRRFFAGLVLRRAACVVAVSKFIASELVKCGVPEEKLAVVLNGVDLERFGPHVDGSRIRVEYGIAESDVLALQLGRILDSKRQEDFAEALAIAVRQAPALRGLMVGWEDPRFAGTTARVGEIARRSNLGDRLIIGAARPEAPELMAAADVIVVPSLDEACPLVVSEAMASGKPAIGVYSGAIPELIEDGDTGFLVAPQSPEQLARCLVRIATDETLRERMGASGRRRAEERFNPSRVGAEFGAIYEGLV